MASQVVEQLSQLESLCERLYLSQVGAYVDQRSFVYRQL